MKSSVEKLSSLSRKLNIQVPAEEVQAAFNKAYQSIQKHAAIKGFRKGKAPLNTVRSVYGDRVKQDVLQDIIQTHYQTALDEHSLDPVTYPTIEFDEFKENDPFAFTAEFEVRPEVKLAQFEKLPVKKEKLEVKESVVDETLEDIRRNRAETSPVLEDRPAQKGDIAVIDFEGSLLTGPLENGSAQDHELELGTNTFIPGFEDAVVGMRVGVTSTVNISFPEDYHVKDLAGKPVSFKVTLKSLKKKSLPELNDDFAKGLGPYESLAKLRETIKEDFAKRETKRIEDDLRNRVMRVLVEKNPVEVPKALLADQKKALVEDFKNRMSQQGMGEDQFEEYKDKWNEDFEKTAAFMIQSSFLVDSIASEYDLRANQADMDARLKEYAQQTGIELAKLREFYGETNRRARLAYQITEEKVLDFLLSKADVTEVSRDEIESEDKADA